MLVFDSATVPVRERRSAITETITSAASATFMTPDRAGDRLHMAMDVWDVGGVALFDTRCSGHTLRRSPRSAAPEEDAVLVTCGLEGRGLHQHLGHDISVGPAAVWATLVTEPYLHHVTDTRTLTVKVPLSLLGMPEGMVAPALALIGTSPLAPLFWHHLAGVRRVADDLNAAAAVSLGTSTLALTRALLASAVGDDREVLEDVLLMRVQAYVSQHLGETDLDASRIAAEHHVSVRQLYKVCARSGLHLEQWIIRQRLGRAHEELARASASGISVTSVAHRWGFKSVSHFARRFRVTYGMSPSEWLEMSR
ncbi:AraC-type DNA-binding protein [Nocardioides sp. YR527]|uniref:helix-turn-helix domain-containing protein n=1 Tax=Nocardioides sp. YR527 TaxID=1881028 RepID=UPI000889EB67|nr:helix-turn-helix domain-containing protein [Nocardioides sp. YR527]SDJ78841.1 AraC-type DNA-binding protein [Nocardioides sp. YR527]